MSCAVVELNENKCIGFHPCKDIDEAHEVFQKIVSEYGVESYEEMIQAGIFESEGNEYTVQILSSPPELPKIDLRTCKVGDKLVCSHGMIFTYAGLNYIGNKEDGNVHDRFPHLVTYPDGAGGTRTHDGFVYSNRAKRLPCDHDIVEIIPQNT